jgi:hypothetical protein
MRKPRDFDSELKALADKAKQLKERRVQRGAAFFQSKARKRGDGPQSQPDSAQPADGGAASA